MRSVLLDPLVVDADRFASEAHAAIGQVRRYTGAPYITHPRAVARLLASITRDPELIAASLLHDTVEDTPVTAEDIRGRFGLRVSQLVDEVSEPPMPEAGNRAARKAREVERLALVSPDGQTLKLADIVDNIAGIVEHDPAFARVYVPEKAALLERLVHGHPTLRSVAGKVIYGALARLPAAPQRARPRSP